MSSTRKVQGTMNYIVRYWLPSGKLHKDEFVLFESAANRFRTLLNAGHKNIKLYTQHRSLKNDVPSQDIGPDFEP